MRSGGGREGACALVDLKFLVKKSQLSWQLKNRWHQMARWMIALLSAAYPPPPPNKHTLPDVLDTRFVKKSVNEGGAG